MRIEYTLRNKIKRQIDWNGREFTFTRYKQDIYHQKTDEIDKKIVVKGFYHEAGGYGGMLNIELFERDGSRTTTHMKPMILCLYEEGKDLQMDDEIFLNGSTYKVIDKSDIQNLNVAFEISLEKINEV